MAKNLIFFVMNKNYKDSKNFRPLNSVHVSHACIVIINVYSLSRAMVFFSLQHLAMVPHCMVSKCPKTTRVIPKYAEILYCIINHLHVGYICQPY